MKETLRGIEQGKALARIKGTEQTEQRRHGVRTTVSGEEGRKK